MAQSTASRNGDSVPEVMAEKELNRAGFATEVVLHHTPTFTSDELRELSSWSQISELLPDVDFADEVVGDGFDVLSGEDKAQLVGIPMVFVQWRFTNGKDGFLVIIDALAKIGLNDTDVRKVRIIDFSAKSGLCQEMRDYTDRTGKMTGLIVRRGLKASTYNFEDPKTGETRVATTYYLDKSK